MRTQLALTAIAAALCACGNRQPKEADDFGASMTARIAVSAQRACAASGLGDLETCAEERGPEAGKAARMAISAQETYMRLCTADLSYDRCNDMLTAAYFVAQK